MLLDQLSLLTAIACSSAALILTLFISWLGSRKDRFLLSWSIGLVLVVGGVVAYGMTVDYYDERSHFISFALTLVGFAFIYFGAVQFRAKPMPVLAVVIITLGLIALTGIPFLVGLSGIGSILANFGLALLMAMAGYEYWAGRHEAPGPMVANAVLYGVASVSFVLCSALMIADKSWALTSRPDNWAEELNAMVMIVGLTGIGAISLTLNQSRWARHHRDEARTDSLTGLLNRRALFGRMAGTRLAPGAAVIMFDLDHFKSINDRLGHAAGDTVLEAFGQLLQSGSRDGDIAARLGGEEFCLVLPALARQSAASVAERIRAAFQATGLSDRDGSERTVSAGVAITGVDGELFETVLSRADIALYAAKSAGRNRVHGPAPRLVA